jgi:hypothetical protein
MDKKSSSKTVYNFKDKSAAFNYLMANAPVGSLEKILFHFSNLYKYKEDANKTVEGILNYHLNHFTILKYKENFVLLSSVNWIPNKSIRVLPMNVFQNQLRLDKANYSHIFNPVKDRIQTSRSNTR